MVHGYVNNHIEGPLETETSIHKVIAQADQHQEVKDKINVFVAFVKFHIFSILEKNCDVSRSQSLVSLFLYLSLSALHFQEKMH